MASAIPDNTPFGVVTPPPEVDVASAPALRLDLAATLERRSWVVVDLSEVTFVDSSGLGVLVASRMLARELGGDLALVGPQPNVATVLDVTGLAAVFVTFESMAALPPKPWGLTEDP
jgi:anti-sigma B factor antagonist